MKKTIIKINMVLSTLICVVTLYGYYVISNLTIEYGKTGYYEGLEGYYFIIVTASPLLVVQVLLAIALLLKNIEPKKAKVSLIPVFFATIFPYSVAIFIG